MQFCYDEIQELIRNATRGFLEKEQPLRRVRELMDQKKDFDPELWKQGAEQGWFTLLVPENYGGGSVTNQPIVDLCVLAEEFGRLVQPGPFASTNIVCDAIARNGSANQKDKYLPGFIAGELTASWCFAEKDAGWDIDRVATTAVVEGDCFLLNGTKYWAESAQSADVLLVTARSDNDLSQFLLPTTTPGLEMRRLSSLDRVRGLYQVSIKNVRIGKDALLGRISEAREEVGRQFQLAVLLQCAESVGGAYAATDMSVEYAKQRKQFGRPIGSYQAIQHKCSNMFIAAESCQAVTQYAAMKLADGDNDANLAIAAAKSFVGEAYREITQEALQTHGGIGFTWEYDLMFYIRHARSNEFLNGNTAFHRERLFRAMEVPQRGH